MRLSDTLRFARDGRCAHNPHGDGRVPRGADLPAWPVAERYGFVWVWPGDPARADQIRRYEDAVNRQQATPLHNAALAGSLASVKALLAAGAKLGVQDNHGETPLHRAATGGHVELIKFFLERGMDPNFRDRQRQTALHQAAEKGQAAAVKFLLENKADPTLVDVGGMTPLQRAERYQHKATVEVLSGAAAKKP